MNGWIGVDLDGVLAWWDEKYFPGIGPPIPVTVARVNNLLDRGKDVRVFTARVAVCDVSPDVAFAEDQRARVEAWCLEHLGRVLPVTAIKDFMMVTCYDDRSVEMITNTGVSLRERLTWFVERERGLRDSIKRGGQHVGRSPSVTPSVLRELEEMLK